MNLIEKLGIENAKALDGMLQKHGVPEDWRIAVINGMWQRSSVGFTHDELRTAIVEHDCDHDWDDISKSDDTQRKMICTYCSSIKYEQLQIELNDCSSKSSFEISDIDHCTDFGNHISPSTIIKDLGGERHG